MHTHAIIALLCSYCRPLSEARGGCRDEHVHSVYDARNVAQDGQQDVDDQILPASVVHQHTDRRKEDGADERQNAPQREHDRHDATIRCEEEATTGRSRNEMFVSVVSRLSQDDG